MCRLIAFVLAVLAAAACSSSSGTTELGYIPGQGQAFIEPAEREQAPVVSGETLDGEPLALSDYAGMPVVLNFWASWCGPCATEAPLIQAVSQEYAGRVQVIGVDIQDRVANANTFERDLGITYPSLFDPSVRIAAQFRGIAPQALPATLVLDAQHRVAVQHFGAV
ncbi:MAG: TlpA family protein disulfide reductase, partial [Egibacteraceae bacterium]